LRLLKSTGSHVILISIHSYNILRISKSASSVGHVGPRLVGMPAEDGAKFAANYCGTEDDSHSLVYNVNWAIFIPLS